MKHQGHRLEDQGMIGLNSERLLWCTNSRTPTARDVYRHGHPDTTRHNIGVFNLCITTKTKCTAVVAVDHEMSFVHITKQALVQVS